MTWPRSLASRLSDDVVAEEMASGGGRRECRSWLALCSVLAANDGAFRAALRSPIGPKSDDESALLNKQTLPGETFRGLCLVTVAITLEVMSFMSQPVSTCSSCVCSSIEAISVSFNGDQQVPLPLMLRLCMPGWILTVILVWVSQSTFGCPELLKSGQILLGSFCNYKRQKALKFLRKN